MTRHHEPLTPRTLAFALWAITSALDEMPDAHNPHCPGEEGSDPHPPFGLMNLDECLRCYADDVVLARLAESAGVHPPLHAAENAPDIRGPGPYLVGYDMNGRATLVEGATP